MNEISSSEKTKLILYTTHLNNQCAIVLSEVHTFDVDKKTSICLGSMVCLFVPYFSKKLRQMKL